MITIEQENCFNAGNNEPVGSGQGAANAAQAGENGNEKKETPSKQLLERVLKELFGESFVLDGEEGYELLAEYVRRNKEQNERLVEALESDPRMGQLLADVIDGKRSAHSALARYFGRNCFDLSEDSPEYAEMLDAEIERREEAMEMAQNKRNYEENLKNSRTAIEKFCKKSGYEPDEFMDRVWNCIVEPILTGKYSPEVCEALDKALRYDSDVHDAFEAGNVKGRNMNIRQMKENFDDGMPKGISGQVTDRNGTKPKNNLIEQALNA